jgi:hypothetical protein
MLCNRTQTRRFIIGILLFLSLLYFFLVIHKKVPEVSINNIIIVPPNKQFENDTIIKPGINIEIIPTAGSIPACFIVLAGPLMSIMKYEATVDTPRIDLLKVAIETIDRNYNAYHGPYPIILFHEDFDEAAKNNVTKDLKHSKTYWIAVDFKTPPRPEVTKEMMDEWTNTEHYRPVGYRMMSRFWSGVVQNHPALKRFSHYIRLDDDSRFINRVPYDLFHDVIANGRKYMYRLLAKDDHGKQYMHAAYKEYVSTYAQEVQPYLDDIAQQQLESIYESQEHPYNNFHLSEMAFWRSDAFAHFFEICDANQIFLRRHVGDAEFHSYPLRLFMTRDQFEQRFNFMYRHNFMLMIDDRVEGATENSWVKCENCFGQ